MASTPAAWLVALVLASGEAMAPADEPLMLPLPSAGDVIALALERADASRKQDVGAGYTFRIERITNKLKGDGRVKETESLLYAVEPVDGMPYARMVRKNDAPLDQKEARKQARKLRDFRDKLAKGEQTDERDDVEFDRELIERYTATVDGVAETDGHLCWVLAFRPREGDLPNRRRIDRALNASAGKIFVDTASYEIVALEFELLRTVKIWWGIVGSVSEATGRIARSEIAPGDWYPTSFDLDMKGRILFKSLDRRMQIRWFDFVPITAGASARAPTISASTDRAPAVDASE